MTAKRPRRKKTAIAPGNKAVGEKDRVPPKETAGAAPARKAALEKSPAGSKPSGAGEDAPTLAASCAEPQWPAAGAPTAAGAMTAKRPPKEKPSVATGNKAAYEKGRVPPKETAGAAPARKAAREKSQPRSKKSGAGKSASRLPATAPPATIKEPVPKKPSRRGDPRASARRHARLAIETLAAVMADPAAAPTMRISAATTLLQWAYGKPTAEGEGAGGKSEQVIRLAWATAGKP